MLRLAAEIGRPTYDMTTSHDKQDQEDLFQAHCRQSREQCRQMLHREGGLPSPAKLLEQLLPGKPPALYATFQNTVYHPVAEAYFFRKHQQKCAAGHLGEVYRRCPDLRQPCPVRTLALATHPRLGAASPARCLPPEVLRHVDSFLPTPSELLRSVAVAASLGFLLYTDS